MHDFSEKLVKKYGTRKTVANRALQIMHLVSPAPKFVLYLYLSQNFNSFLIGSRSNRQKSVRQKKCKLPNIIASEKAKIKASIFLCGN